MKHFIVHVALANLAGLAAAPAVAVDDAHAPKHGGVIVEAKGVDLELVAKPDLIQIYPTDHGKPMKITSGSAKLTLLTGSDKSEVPLALVGDKLEAKGSFKMAKGTKAVAVVTLNGKPPVTARFELK
ncbi:hypothetical protein [Methylibium sp.]|uniref:hypothetical protein n=1 Tax=Methylibium sp. TaxID=2067992 RepID=UPI001812AD2B|nr:hypothetical protein [Methylibium sp.]MBA3591042.1 hypothetical protein [Methylibium sp.]